MTALAAMPLRSAAQSSNGVDTLVQDVVSAAGGRMGSGNPMSAQTILGLPASGSSANAIFTLIGGLPSAQAPAPPVTATIDVTGTVDDPAAAVTVNGTPATVSGTTFTAHGIALTLGANTVSAAATDSLGNTTMRSITVYLDLSPAKKTPRCSIEVQGSIDDATATVSVNGVQATIAAGQFSAQVPLVTGINVLTADARDRAGNTSSSSIHVVVPPAGRPPARPTVGTVGTLLPAVTTLNTVTFGGTKTAGTSIWINDQQVAALNDDTTWPVTVTLVEGDNELLIVAKDTTGAASTSVLVNVILDTLPPVVTFQPPSKTNFNPALLTGSVDDSHTTVTINGVSTTRTTRAFQISLPLVLGPNALHLVATSPNGFVTIRDTTITLGTIPTLQTVQPADGTFLYIGDAATILISAVDQENDPMQYQILLDGGLLSDWGANPSTAWTPSPTQSGLHTVTVSIRDGFGGADSESPEVFVIRRPIDHP